MDKILICDCCSEPFSVNPQHYSKLVIRKRDKGYNICCSKECRFNLRTYAPKQEVECMQCGEKFFKTNTQIKKSPNHFCCQSCAATYNNTHKTKGNRRSKLEVWLEEQLTIHHPNLEILYSDKTIINSELDIYIPSLKLAFELNGIFHYEAIFGEDKLNQIQNNDGRKFQACLEHDIELCIIDVSGQKYFKESTSKKYLDIINQVISMK